MADAELITDEAKLKKQIAMLQQRAVAVDQELDQLRVTIAQRDQTIRMLERCLAQRAGPVQ